MSQFENKAKEVKTLIQARYPILYIISDEREQNIIRILLNICNRGSFHNDLYLWDRISGFCIPNLTPEGNIIDSPVKQESDNEIDLGNPVNALEWLCSENNGDDSIFLLREYHHYLHEPAIQRYFRRFAEYNAVCQKKMIILLSTKNDGIGDSGKLIPTELSNIITLMDWPYPDHEEIKSALLNTYIPNFNTSLQLANDRNMELRNQGKDVKIYDLLNFSDSELNEIIHSCKGMTLAQIDNATSKSMIMHKTLIPRTISNEKKQIIQKSGLAEYIEPDEDLSGIGGLDDLKKWLMERKNILSDEARAFGCKAPNGILLIGPWGAGKSTAAKAVIKEWGLPGIRIDASKIFNKFVGNSERRVRDVLRLAESISPCVVGNTPICVDGKIKHIEDIYKETDGEEFESNNVYYKKINKKILSLDSNGIFRDFSTKYITKRKVSDLVKIKAGGEVLECSKEHKLLCIDEHGNTVWIEAQKITEHDTLIYSLPKSFDKEINKEDFIPENAVCKSKEDVHIPDIDSNLGYYMGLIASGGFCSKKYRTIGFSNTNKDLIDIFEKLTLELFGIQKYSKVVPFLENENEYLDADENSIFKGTTNISFSNYISNIYMNNIFSKICFMPKSFLEGYLSGYMDGDGAATSKDCNIYFCNKGDLIQKDEFKFILSRMGVFSVKDDGGVRITSINDAIKISEIIIDKVVHKEKKRNLQEIIDHTEGGSSKFNSFYDEFFFLKVEGHEIVGGDCFVYDFSMEKSDEMFGRNFISNNFISHNCIVWWDEIENLLAGSNSSSSDGGTSSRVVGIVSTWMSEHEGVVFNIFTANDIGDSPPKLFRKGRLDEIFVVDLPVKEERIKIFEIFVKKGLDIQGRSRLLKHINLDLLASETQGFSGAEIMAVVDSAFVRCFNDGKRELTTEDIREAISSTIPFSCTMKEKIMKIREWLKGRAIPASVFPPEEIEEMASYETRHTQKVNLDLSDDGGFQ